MGVVTIMRWGSIVDDSDKPSVLVQENAKCDHKFHLVHMGVCTCHGLQVCQHREYK